MKSKLIFCLALFLSLAVVTTSADARRFGGMSRSYSKSWSSNSQSSARQGTYIPKQRGYKQSTTNRTQRRGSFLNGAFMGLLAGSLIGSLLSGHGFSGFQFMDLILLFGFGFLVMKLLAHFRRSQDYRR